MEKQRLQATQYTLCTRVGTNTKLPSHSLDTPQFLNLTFFMH